MEKIINDFFNAYVRFTSMRAVYVKEQIPEAMMASPVDNDGWFEWKLLAGSLPSTEYGALYRKYSIALPELFTRWHQKYFFLDGDCSIVRLPFSSPIAHLDEISNILNNDLAKELIAQKLYPFAMQGNDNGFLIFDARKHSETQNYPIRNFDNYSIDLEDGLGEIVFSSFEKMLECLTYFLKATYSQNPAEVIPQFFHLDPDGAGKYGIDYWLSWVTLYEGD